MNTKEIDNEFHRIVECLRAQGDLACIEDIIPTKIKKEFIGRLLNEVIVEHIDNPSDNRVVKLMYKNRVVWIEKKDNYFEMFKGNSFNWKKTAGCGCYTFLNDAIERGKQIIKEKPSFYYG